MTDHCVQEFSTTLQESNTSLLGKFIIILSIIGKAEAFENYGHNLMSLVSNNYWDFRLCFISVGKMRVDVNNFKVIASLCCDSVQHGLKQELRKYVATSEGVSSN